MAKLALKRGTTSKIVRLFIQDSSQADGRGLTGLTNASGSLVAYQIREGQATATAISLSGGTVGTWSSGGFKEVDATNLPGIYELGIPDVALSTGNSAVVMLKGATNMVPVVVEIELDAYDPQDAVRLGLTALPNANAGANGGLPTGDASGRVTVGSFAAAAIQSLWDALTSALTTSGSVGKLLADNLNATVTSRASATDYTTARAAKLDNLDATVSSRSSHTAADVWAATTRTLSAAGVQAIWDALTSALTTVGSVGKRLADNLDATISGRMATYTQPTGFLAATFPATVASPTNITAGTITTATNLTNAPTAGDLTATMKTSLGTAVAASAVAAVTGNVGGNVAGSVGSVTGLTAANLDAAVSSRLATSGYTAPDNATIATRASQASVDTVAGYVDTEVAAIKAKTDNLPASPAAVGSAMTLDLTQAVPTANTAQTVGDALNAARAQGFGKWTLAGTLLVLYAPDGATPVKTFTLDSATLPTSRS